MVEEIDHAYEIMIKSIKEKNLNYYSWLNSHNLKTNSNEKKDEKLYQKNINLLVKRMLANPF